MVDHRHLEHVLRPLQRRGVAALAREEQSLEVRKVVPGDVAAVGILLPDRTKRGRCGEQRAHTVLRDHPPVRTRIGRSDRLAFVEHGRAAVEQRCVDDVRMPHHPPDVRRGPEDLARIDAVHVLHRPREGDRVTAVVANDPLRLAGRARRVEDVQRIRRVDRDARSRLRGRGRRFPVEIPSGLELGLELWPLEDDASLRLVLDEVDRCVEQRLVRDETSGLDAARGGDDDLRPGVRDATGEFGRGKSAEHDGVDRSDARARQHRDDGLGNHRHVDDDAVSSSDALRREHAGEGRHGIAELPVREARPGTRQR